MTFDWDLTSLVMANAELMQNTWCLYEMLHSPMGEAEAGRAIVAARKNPWLMERCAVLFADLPALFRRMSAF
jgi:hypothetical protein